MNKIFVLILFCWLPFIVKADISLPAIFSDSMVLQQRSEVTIWGWAKPLEKIEVHPSWDTTRYRIETNDQGNWSVQVSTPAAGGPFQIHLSGQNKIQLKDVWTGEVWVCSGQSNMEWSANMKIDNAAAEVAAAKFPRIRFFSVHHRSAHDPQIDLEGNWSSCTPASMQDFSAVGYFFARHLHRTLNVPIAMIDASWGGTPAEAWMPEEAVELDPRIQKAAAKLKPVPWGPIRPGSIYNSMIHPLTRFRIAGVIWYQGESNTGNAADYHHVFPALIDSWRTRWENDFPFYYCQIAPFNYGGLPLGAQIRDAQRRTLSVPNTGMVVTSDIGDTTDIHPRNKQDVGLRLANLALVRHYKKLNKTVDGPLYKSHRLEGEKVRIIFEHADGLKYQPGEEADFELAGADGIFYPATTNLEKNELILFSSKVPNPQHARFAYWNTATPNLTNSAGLPASAFLIQLE